MTATLPSQLTHSLGDAELEGLARDGATVLRGVLDLSWIEFMREAIEDVLEHPSPMSREYTKDGDPMRPPDSKRFPIWSVTSIRQTISHCLSSQVTF